VSEYEADAFAAFEAAGWERQAGGGAERLPPLVLGQPTPVQDAIRDRFEQLLDEHRVEDGFEVPVSTKLASGRKGG
jgi:hypothetical protein